MRISDWSSDVCSSDLGERRSGGVGVVPVADRVLVRAGPQLAHLAVGHVPAGVVVDDAHLHPRVRLAGRTHQLRPVGGVVVDAVYLRDGSGGLGETGDMDEIAAQTLASLLTHRLA